MTILDRTYSLRNTQTVFLIFLGILYLYFGFSSLYERIIIWSDGYALGDWIITYEDGGFKRRGLSGSILIFLARKTDIYIGTLLFSFLVVVYLIFISVIIVWLRSVKLDFYVLLFYLLPTTFFFSINDFYVFGRKEILFFLVILFFVIAYKREKNIHSWKFILILSTVLLFLVLLHELVVFFISYILFVYLYDFYFKKKGNLIKIFVLGFSALLPAFCIFIFGGDINEGNSWKIFKSLGIGPNVMNGIFSWPKEGFGSGKVNALQFAKVHHYQNYTISFLITIMCLFILLIKYRYTKKNIIFIFSFLFTAFIISLPLFFLTIDWGRWLNIHFMMLLFLTVLLTKSNEGHSFSINEMIVIFKNPISYLKLLIILLFTFSFSMEHVENGFVLGQNQILINIRDLIWQIRHFIF